MFVKQLDGSYAEKVIGSISGMVVDDTKNFEVPFSVIPPPGCEDYRTESECIGAGCYWYDGSCHKMPPGVVCSDYTTESTCNAAGCYWVDGKCQSTPGFEIPWLIILGAVGGAIALIGIIVAIRR